MGLENPAGVDFYLQISGQRLLETRTGLDLLQRALSHTSAPLTFLYGDGQAIRRFMSRVGESLATVPLPPFARYSRQPLRRQALRGLTDRECLLRELREAIASLM